MEEEIMTKVCELQDFLIDKLNDDDYVQAKEMLDTIWSDAHALKGDM